MTYLHCLIHALPQHKRSNEPTREGVARAIRVDDRGVSELCHGKRLGIRRERRGGRGRRGDDSGLCPVRDHDSAWARSIGLGEIGDGCGDDAEVFRLEMRCDGRLVFEIQVVVASRDIRE